MLLPFIDLQLFIPLYNYFFSSLLPTTVYNYYFTMLHVLFLGWVVGNRVVKNNECDEYIGYV